MIEKTTTPYVSVIMAVYNGERCLLTTISSILAQTFKNFEYIIVNDGSTDNTQSLLDRISDFRVIILSHEHNNGLAYSLNRGLAVARGKYIARIDAGDLADPERLEKQVSFLEQHPDIGIIGTSCRIVSEDGKKLGEARFPQTDLEIRWVSLLTNPFLHPSVMLRYEVLSQHQLRYDETFWASQDYELWTRLLEHTRGANLQDVLTTYRVSDESITAKHRHIQFQNQDIVIRRTLGQQLPGLQISPARVSQLREAFIGGFLPKHERVVLRVKLAWLYLHILAAFVQKHRENPQSKALTQCEALKIAVEVFRPRFASYWLTTLPRVLRLYPDIVFHLAGNMGTYFWRSFTQFFRKSWQFIQKRTLL